MSNMSYCRFNNTAPEVRDCSDHILDHLTGEERRARVSLVYYCIDLLSAIGLDVSDPESPDGKISIGDIFEGLDPKDGNE